MDKDKISHLLDQAFVKIKKVSWGTLIISLLFGLLLGAAIGLSLHKEPSSKAIPLSNDKEVSVKSHKQCATKFKFTTTLPAGFSAIKKIDKKKAQMSVEILGQEFVGEVVTIYGPGKKDLTRQIKNPPGERIGAFKAVGPGLGTTTYKVEENLSARKIKADEMPLTLTITKALPEREKSVAFVFEGRAPIDLKDEDYSPRPWINALAQIGRRGHITNVKYPPNSCWQEKEL